MNSLKKKLLHTSKADEETKDGGDDTKVEEAQGADDGPIDEREAARREAQRRDDEKKDRELSQKRRKNEEKMEAARLKGEQRNRDLVSAATSAWDVSAARSPAFLTFLMKTQVLPALNAQLGNLG
jgi:hypothetical protein